MKVKEFKKAIESIGLYNDEYLRVEEGSYDFYIEIQIESEFKIIATVNKSTNYLIGINYQCFSEMEESLRQDLLDAIYKFTSTPIEEREDEKKYYLRHQWFFKDQWFLYLYRKENGSMGIDTYVENVQIPGIGRIQTKFTQKEIDEIKEKYHTDLNDFAIIEVECEEV